MNSTVAGGYLFIAPMSSGCNDLVVPVSTMACLLACIHAWSVCPAMPGPSIPSNSPFTLIRRPSAGVPSELARHLDPRRPLLLGGLGQGEERLGALRLRIKRHR